MRCSTSWSAASGRFGFGTWQRRRRRCCPAARSSALQSRVLSRKAHQHPRCAAQGLCLKMDRDAKLFPSKCGRTPMHAVHACRFRTWFQVTSIHEHTKSCSRELSGSVLTRMRQRACRRCSDFVTSVAARVSSAISLQCTMQRCYCPGPTLRLPQTLAHLCSCCSSTN
jgi:hypothetical protein